MSSSSHGGARDNRKRRADDRRGGPRLGAGRPPNLRRNAERLAAQIRRIAPGAQEREQIRKIVEQALEAVKQPNEAAGGT